MNPSPVEIEIPRRLAHGFFWLLLVLGLILVGARRSPVGANGGPLLLTPRRAQIGAYRQDVLAWVAILHDIDRELDTLLNANQPNLLDQNERAGETLSRVQRLSHQIDARRVPETFEPLHALLVETGNAYLQATADSAHWIAEPLDPHRETARASLVVARALLQRLDSNPWIEVEP